MNNEEEQFALINEILEIAEDAQGGNYDGSIDVKEFSDNVFEKFYIIRKIDAV